MLVLINSGLLLLMSLALAEVPVSAGEVSDSLTQLPRVSQLSDVRSTDWEFEALQTLEERYGCLADHSDRIEQGNRSFTRYEFAILLNVCLNQISQLVSTGKIDLKEEQILQRLQADFGAELVTLRSQINTLEARTTFLEANQFSTTAMLEGQVIFAANAGGFMSDRLVDPTETEITRQQPNATVLYRALLDFNISFSGQDLLKLRLDTVSGLGDDNASGFLEPNFGSVLEFSVRGTPNQEFGLARAYYSFTLDEDVRLSVGPLISVTDYVDLNSYANGVVDFGTLALVNNYILFPVDVPTAGAAIAWNPGQGPLVVRGVYIAIDAASPGDHSTVGIPAPASLLYPDQDGEGGVFGNPNQGTVEFEYSPSKAFALRLQYGGGNIFDGRFDGFGVNLEWRPFAAASPIWSLRLRQLR